MDIPYNIIKVAEKTEEDRTNKELRGIFKNVGLT